MRLRGLSIRDINQIEKIHRDDYISEFDISELETSNYLGRFSVVEDDKVICAGGVRTLCEAVIVTDKTLPIKIKREALIKVLQASRYLARSSGHNSLHAFVQDEVWLNQLLTRGFTPTKGTSIFTASDE